MPNIGFWAAAGAGGGAYYLGYLSAVGDTTDQWFQGNSKNAFIGGTTVAANTAGLYVKMTSAGAINYQRTLQSTSGDIRANGISVKTGASNDYLLLQDQFSGNSDIVVAKVDSTPAITWQRRLGLGAGGSNNVQVRDIAIDSSENVIASAYDGVAAKGIIGYWNTSGTLQWQRSITPASNQIYDNAVAFDSSGNVIFAGQWNNYPASKTRMTIVKLNSSGTTQWQRYLAGSDDLPLPRVAADASGNVYVAFRNQTTTPWGLAVVKYNSSGIIQWQKNLYDASFNHDTPSGIVFDASGNLIIAGTQGLTRYSQIVSISPTGTLNWQRSLKMKVSGVYKNYYPTTYGFGINDAGTGFVLGGTVNTDLSSAAEATYATLPTDGSKTGTYTSGVISWEYATTSLTWTDAGLTDGAASNTIASSSYGESAATLGLTTSTYTANNVSI
jgi:hypothetical protein